MRGRTRPLKSSRENTPRLWPGVVFFNSDTSVKESGNAKGTIDHPKVQGFHSNQVVTRLDRRFFKSLFLKGEMPPKSFTYFTQIILFKT